MEYSNTESEMINQNKKRKTIRHDYNKMYATMVCNDKQISETTHSEMLYHRKTLHQNDTDKNLLTDKKSSQKSIEPPETSQREMLHHNDKDNLVLTHDCAIDVSKTNQKKFQNSIQSTTPVKKLKNTAPILLSTSTPKMSERNMFSEKNRKKIVNYHSSSSSNNSDLASPKLLPKRKLREISGYSSLKKQKTIVNDHSSSSSNNSNLASPKRFPKTKVREMSGGSSPTISSGNVSKKMQFINKITVDSGDSDNEIVNGESLSINRLSSNSINTRFSTESKNYSTKNSSTSDSSTSCTEIKDFKDELYIVNNDANQSRYIYLQYLFISL